MDVPFLLYLDGLEAEGGLVGDAARQRDGGGRGARRDLLDDRALGCACLCVCVWEGGGGAAVVCMKVSQCAGSVCSTSTLTQPNNEPASAGTGAGGGP